jgi:hypothetical protein
MATDTGPPVITGVEQAFALGWQVAELFHSPIHEKSVGYGEFGERLPGVSQLILAERSLLLARQIESGFLLLNIPIQPNHPAPSTKNVEGLLRSDPPRNRPEIRQALWDLHIDLLEALMVADFRLGKAYSLGRALAETVIIPTLTEATQVDAFAELFRFGRLEELKNWLTELKTNFGPHASYAVHGSLDRWSGWIYTTADIAEAKNLHKALSNQGRIWRGLLSGEKQATDLLSAVGYIEGALALLKRIGKLTRSFLWSLWGVGLLCVAAAVGLVVWCVSVIHALNPGNKLAADLVLLVSSLGLTAKAVMSSLGKITAKAEGPLWESELDESCAVSATRLPDDVPVRRHYRASDGVTPTRKRVFRM